MKRISTYVISTLVLVSMSLILSSCNLQSVINDVIDQVKGALYDRLDEEEKKIADFDEYTPPITEEYVGNTPYDGVSYNQGGGTPEEGAGYSQIMESSGGSSTIFEVQSDMYDVTADADLTVEQELVWVPLGIVRKKSLQKQLDAYNTGKTTSQRIYFNTGDKKYYFEDNKELDADAEKQVNIFIANSIARENIMVKKKAASLLQAYAQTFNGLLFSYVFQKMLVDEGGVPSSATVNIDGDFLDKFSSYYESSVGRPLPDVISLVGGIQVPQRALRSSPIEIKLKDIIKYDFQAQGVATSEYDIKISAKFTMMSQDNAHPITFGGDDYIASVFFKFNNAKDVDVFKFVFHSPMTKLYDYTEILIHDLSAGEFTNIRQYISAYFIDETAVQGGHLSAYYDKGDLKLENGEQYFPILELFTAKFKERADAEGYRANVSMETRGIKPLSKGLVKADGSLSNVNHPLFEGLYVRGVIQKNAAGAVMVKQRIGKDVYDDGESSAEHNFAGRLEILADGTAKNFKIDPSLSDIPKYKKELEDIDDDNEDVEFGEHAIKKDKEYQDMKKDYVLDESMEKLHETPDSNLHQGMEKPLLVYAGYSELVVYFSGNLEDTSYDPDKFSITRGASIDATTTPVEFRAVGVDSGRISNYLIFILADNEKLPAIGEWFTVTAEPGAITVSGGTSNTEAIQTSNSVRPLSERPHEW